MSAGGDVAAGVARARMLRLAHELAAMRGVPRDRVVRALMASRAYDGMGRPPLRDLSGVQADALSGLLSHWIAQVRKGTPRDGPAPPAPPAPWREDAGNEARENR